MRCVRASTRTQARMQSTSNVVCEAILDAIKARCIWVSDPRNLHWSHEPSQNIHWRHVVSCTCAFEYVCACLRRYISLYPRATVEGQTKDKHATGTLDMVAGKIDGNVYFVFSYVLRSLFCAHSCQCLPERTFRHQPALEKLPTSRGRGRKPTKGQWSTSAGNGVQIHAGILRRRVHAC